MGHTFRILHCLRAPVGGLFRHVSDLSAAQTAAGHAVGVVVDSASADSLTEQRLAALAGHLSLGLHRTAMSRDIGWRDLTATSATAALASRLDIEVIHGHGAKGGAYARLAAVRLEREGRHVRAFYTPHGGSLHYAPTSIKGRVFMALERNLARATAGIVFESAYSAAVYARNVAALTCPARVIPNGLLPQEFGTHTPAAAATDIVYIGELRRLKGVDVLLHALARPMNGRPASATIVGDGPDAAEFKALSRRLGLDAQVTFPGAMPAARAFPLGRVLAMPSRAESFPYIVLEAAAAGIPLVATAVGGIPEIVAGTDTKLVTADDVDALHAGLDAALREPAGASARAAMLRSAVAARFTVARMAADVEAFYRDAGH
jgi:glycosyltransferase involved in cell wall biosynthesis